MGTLLVNVRDYPVERCEVQKYRDSIPISVRASAAKFPNIILLEVAPQQVGLPGVMPVWSTPFWGHSCGS